MITAVLALLATRSVPAASVFLFPFIAALSAAEGNMTVAAAAAGFSAVSLWYARKHRIFPSLRHEDIRTWRLVIRPFAMVFIPVQQIFGPAAALGFIGTLAAVSLGIDLVRISSRYTMAKLYRAREQRRLSSVTSFLTASLLLFLLFSPPVSYIALGYITFGDLLSKLLGLRFGRRVLKEGRTLEGSLAFLMGSLTSGYVLFILFPYPLPLLFIGPAAAAAAELISVSIDDNFSVGLISAAVLAALMQVV